MKNVKFILTLIMALVFSAAIFAQDTVSDQKRKVITIKVESDGDDEIITIDEDHFKDMEKQLKEMEIHLEGIEFDADEFEKLINVYEHRKIPHHIECFSDHPGLFHYNWISDRHDKDFMRFKSKKGESLSDVLGDIPMSAVKRYKIRDTKYGKKIVIEVNNDFKMHHSENIIVITPPRPPRVHVKMPRHPRKIVIERDSDDN